VLTGDELVEVALRLLREAPYGFLVTAESDGPPSGRLVQHLEVTADLAVTFSTSPRSRKAVRIARWGSATYLVEDLGHLAYAALAGPARLIEDLDERRRLWHEGLRAFFPDGPAGDDFVLVTLAAERVELWSLGDGVHPEPYGLIPASAVRTGEGWRTVAAERHARASGEFAIATTAARGATGSASDEFANVSRSESVGPEARKSKERAPCRR
jgi:general stress protein 26